MPFNKFAAFIIASPLIVLNLFWNPCEYVSLLCNTAALKLLHENQNGEVIDAGRTWVLMGYPQGCVTVLAAD